MTLREQAERDASLVASRITEKHKQLLAHEASRWLADAIERRSRKFAEAALRDFCQYGKTLKDSIEREALDDAFAESIASAERGGV